MRRKAIVILSPEELEMLPTRQLLARLERLRQCEESASLSDANQFPNLPGVLFKDTEEWAASYEQVKSVLARGEHLPKGDELTVQRNQRAKLSRTSERKAGRRMRH